MDMKTLVASAFAKYLYKAEEATRNAIEEKYWDSDEEFITAAFRGELRIIVEQDRELCSILGSLREGIVCAMQAETALFANGKRRDSLESFARSLQVIAKFHPREVEKDTGGDLGLVISWPELTVHDLQASELKTKRCGALVQAKLKGRDGKWGVFTKNQEKTFGIRRDHAALLFYSYKESGPVRRKLSEFRWKSCLAASLEDMKEWLKHSEVQSCVSTGDAIMGLAGGNIGTCDEDVIDECILRGVRKSDVMEIRFEFPRDALSLLSFVDVEDEVHVGVGCRF
jgi:hypothetical protein